MKKRGRRPKSGSPKVLRFQPAREGPAECLPGPITSPHRPTMPAPIRNLSRVRVPSARALAVAESAADASLPKAKRPKAAPPTRKLTRNRKVSPPPKASPKSKGKGKSRSTRSGASIRTAEEEAAGQDEDMPPADGDSEQREPDLTLCASQTRQSMCGHVLTFSSWPRLYLPWLRHGRATDDTVSRPASFVSGSLVDSSSAHRCEHCSNWYASLCGLLSGSCSPFRPARFHFACIGLAEQDASQIEAYGCDLCQEVGHAPTRSESFSPGVPLSPATVGHSIPRMEDKRRRWPWWAARCSASAPHT